jgi:hypothetical protein
VFENHTWDKTVSSDYSVFNGKRISPRTPLTAPLFGASVSSYILPTLILLSNPGSVAGDPFPLSAVLQGSRPKSYRHRLQKEIGDALSTESGATILHVWIEKFERMEDRCVDIKGHSGQIFSLWCGLPFYVKLGLI